MTLAQVTQGVLTGCRYGPTEPVPEPLAELPLPWIASRFSMNTEHGRLDHVGEAGARVRQYRRWVRERLAGLRLEVPGADRGRLGVDRGPARGDDQIPDADAERHAGGCARLAPGP
ncbi:hypothetical protein GCM10010341_65070 [Streptomyces noursei]|nr:hypothetical protein GCM10010341_65070 [Streptomyces noursei]